jgi:hypothetical protein
MMTKAVVPEMEKRGYGEGDGAPHGLRGVVFTRKRVSSLFLPEVAQW